MNPQDEPTSRKSTAAPAGKPWRFVLLLTVLAAGLVLAQWYARGDASQDKVAWRASYDQARQEAAANDKPMLVMFSAEWCEPCNQMKAWVLSDQGIADVIEAGFVPVRVDLTDPGPTEEAIALRYGVQGIPALLVCDAEGTPVSMSAGYLSKDELRNWLAQATARQAAAG